MKVYTDDLGRVVVELTRRNLRALLAKLDLETSARTLSRLSVHGTFFCRVTAVEDEEHYADRPPGLLSPETLEAMKEAR